jgi:hypothetical protein
MLPGFLSSFITPYTIPQLLLCFAKLLIIPDKCQETHNAHTQEWSNSYKGWIKSTWAHWHTHPPPASEVRSSKSQTPSLPASERGSFLTGAARLASAPKISARLENRHPNQELKCIPYQPLSFTYKPSSDYIRIMVSWSQNGCSWRKAALKAILKMQTHFDALTLWLTSPATNLNEDAQLLVPP